MRIYFAPAYGRTIDVPHMFCVMQLLRVPGLTYEPVTNDALIERSRSIAATRFLYDHPDCDVFLSIDSDVIFRVADAVRICMQAVELGAVVGGVYVTRDRENTWPTSDWEGTIDFGGEIGVDDAPVEAKYLATGFMAVPRIVLEKLAATMPLCHEDRDWKFHPFYQCFPIRNEAGKWIFLSEDFSFCYRAKELGFKCLINPAVRLHHYGIWPFRLEDMVQKPVPMQPVAVTSTLLENGRPGWRVETLREQPVDGISSPTSSSSVSVSSTIVPSSSRGAGSGRNGGNRGNKGPLLIVPVSRGAHRVN